MGQEQKDTPPQPPQQSGVDKLGHDVAEMATEGADAIASGWKKYVAPKLSVLAKDFEQVAADGRKKWDGIGQDIAHPVEHHTASKFTRGYFNFSDEPVGQQLKEAGGFLLETGAAAVSVVVGEVKKDVEMVERIGTAVKNAAAKSGMKPPGK